MIMAKSLIALFLFSLLLSVLLVQCQCTQRKIHVIYMGDRVDQVDKSVASSHVSMLHNVLGSVSSAEESLIHSYGRSFNGFAAKLTTEEARTISGMEGVVSVMPNRVLQLHTTRSWDFMGFTQDKVGAGKEGDVIIGLLDTGAWPEHPSFNDTGYGPPPAKWKGECQTKNFTCNNKLIGARFYNSRNSSYRTDIQSPRDSEGHGTHTSSTVAGVTLPGTSYYGLAEGVARGGVPNSRIAVYKVCWASGCGSADILKAFDDAIADGVDILSISVGGGLSDYFNDPIAIGSFHAMKHGILVSNSAGNGGPLPVTVANYAPWTLTVAASTIDRKFVANLALGDGQILSGVSINTFDLNATTFPLVWGGDAANYSVGSDPEISRYCFQDFMNYDAMAGKIVFCEAQRTGQDVILAHGVGLVMSDSQITNLDHAFSYPLPATLLHPEDGKKVFDYIRSTDYPIATILVGETWKDAMAPLVASFSSRGPNPITPDILKPDITAPGVDILAGWSPMAPQSVSHYDTRSVLFNVISGTSMSCPHASATAAYVKAAHPDWSPAAIKSAIMTTAHRMDPSRHKDLEFAYGSGHINPAAALDPGLVFDASEADYVDFLCKQGYNTTTIRLVTGDNSSCASTTPGRGWDLNYPSFSLYIEDGKKILGIFNRTVTNVGTANSTYSASMQIPELVSVTVEPAVLTFSEVGEKQSFTVKVTGPVISMQPIVSGSITWSDQTHSVRTPLVIYNYILGEPYDLNSDESSVPEKRRGFNGSVKYRRKASVMNRYH